jgi:hypothetical protein
VIFDRTGYALEPEMQCLFCASDKLNDYSA